MAYEDTRTKEMGYIVKEGVNVYDLTNDTGADLAQGDICVIGAWPGVALDDIANGAVGPIYVGQCVVSTLKVAAAATFGSIGDPVYWDDTNKEITDVATANTLIGYVVEPKGADGAVVFEKIRIKG